LRRPSRLTTDRGFLLLLDPSQPRVRLLIGGEFVESRADEHVDVTNPVKPPFPAYLRIDFGFVWTDSVWLLDV
jgi:hypothetical protein